MVRDYPKKSVGGFQFIFQTNLELGKLLFMKMLDFSRFKYKPKTDEHKDAKLLITIFPEFFSALLDFVPFPDLIDLLSKSAADPNTPQLLMHVCCDLAKIKAKHESLFPNFLDTYFSRVIQVFPSPLLDFELLFRSLPLKQPLLTLT